MPSIPGDLFDFIFWRTCPTSSTVTGSPMSSSGTLVLDLIPKFSKFIFCRASFLFPIDWNNIVVPDLVCFLDLLFLLHYLILLFLLFFQ